ncbi:hypothetical protein LSAT2_031789 [Lamellibrachia satsuma]|nr:hypothetical protein LSAT2_031789 [Lamellibrachia satsuma]
MSTKEITETRNGKTSVHRVGPLAGLSAIVFWGAIAAFIITVVAMATPYWFKIGHNHQGLWKTCQGSFCVEIPASLLQGWFKGIRALVSLSLIASIGTLILATLYTFVHSVNKILVLRLCFVATVLAALFMLGGFAWFAAKVKDHFAYSFFLAVVAFVLHVVVAIVGGLQMNRSTA